MNLLQKYKFGSLIPSPRLRTKPVPRWLGWCHKICKVVRIQNRRVMNSIHVSRRRGRWCAYSWCLRGRRVSWWVTWNLGCGTKQKMKIKSSRGSILPQYLGFNLQELLAFAFSFPTKKLKNQILKTWQVHCLTSRTDPHQLSQENGSWTKISKSWIKVWVSFQMAALIIADHLFRLLLRTPTRILTQTPSHTTQPLSSTKIRWLISRRMKFFVKSLYLSPSNNRPSKM